MREKESSRIMNITNFQEIRKGDIKKAWEIHKKINPKTYYTIQPFCRLVRKNDYNIKKSIYAENPNLAKNYLQIYKTFTWEKCAYSVFAQRMNQGLSPEEAIKPYKPKARELRKIYNQKPRPVSFRRFYFRTYKGWDIEKALTEPHCRNTDPNNIKITALEDFEWLEKWKSYKINKIRVRVHNNQRVKEYKIWNKRYSSHWFKEVVKI